MDLEEFVTYFVSTSAMGNYTFSHGCITDLMIWTILVHIICIPNLDCSVACIGGQPYFEVIITSVFSKIPSQLFGQVFRLPSGSYLSTLIGGYFYDIFFLKVLRRRSLVNFIDIYLCEKQMHTQMIFTALI